MKRLMTVVLVALLSLGVASVSLAQEGGAAGAKPAGEMQQGGKAEKPAKKKHAKKHKKGKKKAKKEAPAEEAK